MRAVSSARSTVALGAMAGLLVGAAAVGAAQSGRPALIVVLLPLQVLIAGCWLRGLAVPRSWIGVVLAAAAALTADLVVCRHGHRHGAGGAGHTAGLGGLAGIAGVALLATVVIQLADRHRERVTDALTGQISAILLAMAPACLVALRGADSGRHAAVAGLLALACGGVLGRLVDGLLPAGVGGHERALIVLLTWASAGAAAGAAYLSGQHGRGAVIGVACGAAGGVAAQLARAWTSPAAAVPNPPVPSPGSSVARPGGWGAFTSAPVLGALLPLAAAAPTAYALGRVLLG